jgi:hypothetical protein
MKQRIILNDFVISTTKPNMFVKALDRICKQYSVDGEYNFDFEFEDA